MMDTEAAARYARALFAAARSAKADAKVREDLRRFDKLLRTDAGLARTLNHPMVPAAEKENLAKGKLGAASPLFVRFLGLLLSKKRLGLLPFIVRAFEASADEADGVRKVQVKSAAPLSAAQTAELEKRLAAAWGGRVSAETSVDESLIGGLILRLGDRLWDASVRGRLRRMREGLLGAAKN
ncbi:MAG: ATP synthase F1 subunit delta [Elusimicrobiota bacterium]